MRGCAPQDDSTPLHIAANRGHDAVVRILVEAGADVTAKDKVSERRVGGDGQMLSMRRDCSEWGQPLGEPQSPAWNADCLLSPTDATRKRNAHQCADVQGLLLRRRRCAFFWVWCVFRCVG